MISFFPQDRMADTEEEKLLADRMASAFVAYGWDALTADVQGLRDGRHGPEVTMEVNVCRNGDILIRVHDGRQPRPAANRYNVARAVMRATFRCDVAGSDLEGTVRALVADQAKVWACETIAYVRPANWRGQAASECEAVE